jgi:hypothetical protein
MCISDLVYERNGFQHLGGNFQDSFGIKLVPALAIVIGDIFNRRTKQFENKTLVAPVGAIKHEAIELSDDMMYCHLLLEYP